MNEFTEWTYTILTGALRLAVAAFAGLVAVGIILMIVIAIWATVQELRGRKKKDE